MTTNLVLNSYVGCNVKVKRLNHNDCWNVAISLGVNKPYETVRRKFKGKLRNGTTNTYFLTQYIKKYYYEPYYTDCKTLRSLADDTQYTEYEYLVYVSGHMVYIRYGVVYDSVCKDLARVQMAFRRKINKNRKPIHKYLTKQESQEVLKNL